MLTFETRYKCIRVQRIRSSQRIGWDAVHCTKRDTHDPDISDREAGREKVAKERSHDSPAKPLHRQHLVLLRAALPAEAQTLRTQVRDKLQHLVEHRCTDPASENTDAYEIAKVHTFDALWIDHRRFEEERVETHREHAKFVRRVTCRADDDRRQELEGDDGRNREERCLPKRIVRYCTDLSIVHGIAMRYVKKEERRGR